MFKLLICGILAFRMLQCSSNLTSLAQGLPDVLMAFKAPATLDKYHSAWNWVGSNGHPDFHALMCFLLNLSLWPYI